MDFVWLIITVVVGAAATLWQSAIGQRYVNKAKRERALERLQGEYYYQVGKIIEYIHDPQCGVMMCEGYQIVSMELGRVVLRSPDGKTVLPMSAIDFEGLQVFIKDERKGGS